MHKINQTNPPSLIGVDWGTSNFRAFLLDAQGQLLEKKFARQGILHIPRHHFKQTLMRQIKEWLDHYPQLPVIMSGMIGSRQGWKEVPYVSCPAALTALYQDIQEVIPKSNLWLVPGLRVDYDDGQVDVMRGEETQILGALTLSEQKGQKENDHHNGTEVFCLPGTHCKWVWAKGDTIAHFTTFMTGEIFTLLAKHSILGKLMRNTKTNIDAFNRGLDWKQTTNLLSLLFQVRTQVLAGNLRLDEVHSFLSGLLIGQEMRQSLQYPIPGKKVILIGNPRISKLYNIALNQYGLEGVVKDADAVTALGLFRIAAAAKLKIPASS